MKILNVKTLARVLAVVSAILFGIFTVMFFQSGGQMPASPARDGSKELLGMLIFLGVNAFTLGYLSIYQASNE